MKYAFAAAALIATVTAQSISDIPACAQPCIDASRTKVTTCTADDYACLCDNITAIQGDATTCVIAACGADVAVGQVLPATQKFCEEVAAGGGTTAVPTSTAAETTTAAPTTVAGTTETVVPTTATETSVVSTASGGYSASTPEGTTTVETATTYKPTTVVTSTTKHSNGTASATSNPTTVVTAGAALATAGSIGMLLLGALAAL